MTDEFLFFFSVKCHFFASSWCIERNFYIFQYDFFWKTPLPPFHEPLLGLGLFYPRLHQSFWVSPQNSVGHFSALWCPFVVTMHVYVQPLWESCWYCIHASCQPYWFYTLLKTEGMVARCSIGESLACTALMRRDNKCRWSPEDHVAVLILFIN